jgi:hypothetical protein
MKQTSDSSEADAAAAYTTATHPPRLLYDSGFHLNCAFSARSREISICFGVIGRLFSALPNVAAAYAFANYKSLAPEHRSRDQPA